MITYYHQCSSYREEQLDQTSQCHMQLRSNMALPCPLPPPVKAQDKNETAPTHDYKLNQDVMYLDPASKKWFPATIVCLLDAKCSYLIRTPEGVEYRRTQQHLKPYKRKVCVPPQSKQKDSTLAQGRSKRNTKAPDKLDL